MLIASCSSFQMFTTPTGVQTRRSFTHKRTISDDAMHLKMLDPFIGNLALKQVHIGSPQEFIAKRRTDGVKTNTINLSLAVVRRIVNLAATEWRDEQGMTCSNMRQRSDFCPSMMRDRHIRSRVKNKQHSSKSCLTISHVWHCSRSTQDVGNRKRCLCKA